MQITLVAQKKKEKPLAKRIERYGSLPQIATIQGKTISSSIGLKT